MESTMPPGTRIKLYRQRAGLTQEQAAQLKGCTVSCWRKWEQGERQVTALSDWIEIARIVRVKDLYRLTGLSVGQLPDDPVEHESVQVIRTAMYSYTPRLDGAPDLARLREMVDWGWDAWHTSGQRYSSAGPLLPQMITDVRATLAMAGGDERRRAHRIAMDAYLLVRAYAKRVGSLDVSAVAADRATACADIADDPRLRAAAAWNTAMVLSTQGHPEEAAQLAREAIADLQRRDDQCHEQVALIGSLHLLLAVQEARMREERRALNALAVASEAAGVTGETNYHRLVFGPVNCGVHHGAVCLELSRPGEALHLAESLDVTPSASIERRHAHYLDLARAYAIRREDVGATHMLLRADRECPEESRYNLTLRGVLRDLLSRETPTTRPDLRPLAGRLGMA